jgi:hypothetical protein
VSKPPLHDHPPVIIGGTGGSGTRAVAQVLASAGIFMGSHLNDASDAKPLARFDTLWGERYLQAELAGEQPPVQEMQEQLQSAIERHLDGFDPARGAWGWKHPHAYLLLPWLDDTIPALRFVHVVRDGRRMAFSENQRQPQRYGGVVFGSAASAWEPHILAVRFWCWANERAADYGEQRLGERYLRVRFEDLCTEPHATCAELLAFGLADTAPAQTDVTNAAQLVHAPPLSTPNPLLLAAVEREGWRSLRRFGYL